jgi:hypothetical protein
MVDFAFIATPIVLGPVQVGRIPSDSHRSNEIKDAEGGNCYAFGLGSLGGHFVTVKMANMAKIPSDPPALRWSSWPP